MHFPADYLSVNGRTHTISLRQYIIRSIPTVKQGDNILGRVCLSFRLQVIPDIPEVCQELSLPFELVSGGKCNPDKPEQTDTKSLSPCYTIYIKS